MDAKPYILDAPEERVWDVVVIGTGMAGSTVGHALAQQGHDVLFLEKGMFLFGDHDRGDGCEPPVDAEEPAERLRRGEWPLPIKGTTSFGSAEFYAPLGCGTGGSTSIYAAQLERFSPIDFNPRANHPNVDDSALPESWPIAYEDLAPYYAEAEERMAVCGTPDPLSSADQDSLLAPPALSPRDRDLFDSFQDLGFHPYRSHVGCRFVEGCRECGGVLCPRTCRTGDAGRSFLLPALEQHGAKILPNCEVLRLEADTRRVSRVHCERDGKEFTVEGKIVILASGALMTPILLLNSCSPEWPDGLANRSGLVGRNLMLHTTDFIAVRPRRQLAAEGPRKTISFNDFYVLDGVKLGTFQSVGIRISWGFVLFHLRNVSKRDPKWWMTLARPFFRPVAYLAGYYFRKAKVFASIVEDLPYHDNRVVPDPDSDNGMRFEYDYGEELLERNRVFRRELKKRLSPTLKLAVITGPNNLNWGHACGTCRFADDPAEGVLDRNNRAHDVDNLYVLDASFFPSSGGTNPSLTICANALRVAKGIHERLRVAGSGAC